MKFSFLYRIPEAGTPVGPILYDLSLDRAVRSMVPDSRHADYFLSLLEKPLQQEENIRYRQELYRDLETIDGLFAELRLWCSRYDKIRQDWQDLRLGAAPTSSASVDPEALLEHTFASLKVTALFPSTIVSYFSSLCDILSRYPIRSDALCSIRDYCGERIRNQSLLKLVEIANRFRYHSPEHFRFTAAVTLDETLRLASLGLSDITEYKESGPSLLSLFAKKSKDKPEEYDIASLNEDNQTDHAKHGKQPMLLDDLSFEDSLFLQNEALSRIDDTLSRVTGEVYETFFGLSREIQFYEAALAVGKKIREAGIPLTMPEIRPAEEDSLSFTVLRDLLLISEGKGKDGIVPNNVSLDPSKNGMLIRGLTDSGKTVFLRSVGTAQLLAQSGLPVPAESGSVSIRHGFFSHFSSAEEAFAEGDVAGRFEGEAREVASILSKLVPHSLVFFNETFQTTSYQEGTEGMAEVLRILPALQTQFIFVTHLTRLFDVMREEPLLFAETGDRPEVRYQILPIFTNKKDGSLQ